MTHAPISHSSIVAAVEDGVSYSRSHRLWSAASDKVFESTLWKLQRRMLNPGVVLMHDNTRSQTARRSTHLLLNSAGRCLIIHPIARTLHSEIHLFIHLKKFLSDKVSIFRMTGGDECYTAVPILGGRQGYKSWSHGVTNVSIPRVNMFKNSSTLAVSVPINLSFRLCFVSVHGPRKTYFVESLRT